MTATAAPPMVVMTGPEMTESYEPFMKFCPRCQVSSYQIRFANDSEQNDFETYRTHKVLEGHNSQLFHHSVRWSVQNFHMFPDQRDHSSRGVPWQLLVDRMRARLRLLPSALLLALLPVIQGRQAHVPVLWICVGYQERRMLMMLYYNDDKVA